MTNEKETRRLRFEMTAKLSRLADESDDHCFALASVLLDPLATDEEVAAAFVVADKVSWLENILAEAKRIEEESDAAATFLDYMGDKIREWNEEE